MGLHRQGERARALAVAVLVAAAIGIPIGGARAAIAAPTITAPTPGSLQPGAPPVTVRIAGTSDGGATIDVFEGVSELGTAVAGTNGRWSLQVPLSGGPHAVYAIAHDAAGNTSSPSSTIAFEVDGGKPTLSVAAPADAHVYRPGEKLEVRGVADDDRGILGLRLDYYQLNKIILRSTADCTDCGTSRASWKSQPSLAPGYYVVKITAIDVAGNQSEPVSRSFLAGLENAPPPPTIQPPPNPEAPKPPVITTPDSGDLIPAATSPVPVRGRSEPGSTVAISDRSRGVLAHAITNERGRWAANIWLASGAYYLQAQAIDSDGNVSPISKLIGVAVDANRPNLAVLTESTTVFTALEPVVIEGRVLDNRRIASVWLEYWLLDELVLTEKARCAACKTQEALWTDKPSLSTPGYYYVKVHAFDAAGNRSYIATTNFVKAG